MNNKLLAAVIGLVAAALIGAVLVFALRQSASSDSDAPASGSNSGSSTTNVPGGSADNGESTVRSGEVTLEIKDFAFQPKNITVQKGTKVTWTNRDEVQHDITPVTAKAGAPRSELLAQSETYSHTFNTAGEFSYICSPHPHMKGKVIVVEE